MESDAELVRAVLLGKREKFAPLVARYERVVWATAWRVLRDEHSASDATQDAFLQAFRRLRDLREPGAFGLWVQQIASREAVRLARRQSRRSPSATIDDDVPGSDGPTASLSADAEDVLAAVARLPDHERTVVVLRYIDGRTVAEIAGALGRPVGTVTKQLSRALARLRASLREVIS